MQNYKGYMNNTAHCSGFFSHLNLYSESTASKKPKIEPLAVVIDFLIFASQIEFQDATMKIHFPSALINFTKINIHKLLGRHFKLNSIEIIKIHIGLKI